MTNNKSDNAFKQARRIDTSELMEMNKLINERKTKETTTLKEKYKVCKLELETARHRLDERLGVSEAKVWDRIEDLLEENKKLKEALPFFRSVILCGEQWTETCEKIFKQAWNK